MCHERVVVAANTPRDAHHTRVQSRDPHAHTDGVLKMEGTTGEEAEVNERAGSKGRIRKVQVRHI